MVIDKQLPIHVRSESCTNPTRKRGCVTLVAGVEAKSDDASEAFVLARTYRNSDEFRYECGFTALGTLTIGIDNLLSITRYESDSLSPRIRRIYCFRRILVDDESQIACPIGTEPDSMDDHTIG